jgi:hypothetical protein
MGTSYLFNWYQDGTLGLLIRCSLCDCLSWLVLTQPPKGPRTHRTDFLLLGLTFRSGRPSWTKQVTALALKSPPG